MGEKEKDKTTKGYRCGGCGGPAELFLRCMDSYESIFSCGLCFLVCGWESVAEAQKKPLLWQQVKSMRALLNQKGWPRVFELLKNRP